ncbi:hypothetical protein [Altererythrobacter sp.]|uniref:hypothetical protein n=1 Tax=Altererythrobacter sp. TaxID=1872480 RepID=UPI001B2B1209|nr:hypothetical protein [Altererythrobacter sp.]MBO6946218.1 hypothetical protein [Altererythrobacter sp.]
MKNIAMVAATAVAFIAVPAKADETRLEARGGVVWFDGGEEAVAGVAAGHDFHLDESFFIGIEGSADKVLADGACCLEQPLVRDLLLPKISSCLSQPAIASTTAMRFTQVVGFNTMSAIKCI